MCIHIRTHPSTHSLTHTFRSCHSPPSGKLIEIFKLFRPALFFLEDILHVVVVVAIDYTNWLSSSSSSHLEKKVMWINYILCDTVEKHYEVIGKSSSSSTNRRKVKSFHQMSIQIAFYSKGVYYNINITKGNNDILMIII